jgi:hypothetical protein
MDQLQAEADQVRSIIGRGVTPERRELLNQALSSKWEGTQAHAIKALPAWGDRDSIGAIRDFLISAFDRKYEGRSHPSLGSYYRSRGCWLDPGALPF